MTALIDVHRARSVVIDFAVFACFNPPSDIIDRIAAVALQVSAVVVVDDGSTDIDLSMYDALAAIDNVSVVVEPENRGIAHSLNIGFAAALEAGANSVVAFDQDAIVDDSLIESLARAVRELDRSVPDWGAVGPGVVNGFTYDGNRNQDLVSTYELIQSAAVFNARALRECGLADESLFIDSVDTDLCLKLRAGGFGVYVDGRIELAHPIGNGRTFDVFGRRLSSTNHSATRRYYMTRNRLVMFARYGRAEKKWCAGAMFWFVVSIVLSITVADHRWATLRATARGMGDFARGRRGPLPGADRRSVQDGIAVVLVTHNGTRYLRKQLESMVAQDVPPDSVYLVDDQSSDGSSEYVADFFAQHSEIPLKVVPAPAQRSSDLYTRIAANFSAGLVAASGFRYIAFADQDDVWEPDRLVRQRCRLEASGALLTAGNGSLIDADGVLTGETLRDRFPVLAEWEAASSVVRLRSVLRESMATGAALMVDRRIVDLGVPIPPGWLHDRWLSLVAGSRDGLDVDDAVVIQYRIYPEQVVGLSGENKVSSWKRIADAARKPYLSVRKVRHLTWQLRRVARDPSIRSELSIHGVLRTYLYARTHRRLRQL